MALVAEQGDKTMLLIGECEDRDRGGLDEVGPRPFVLFVVLLDEGAAAGGGPDRRGTTCRAGAGGGAVTAGGGAGMPGSKQRWAGLEQRWAGRAGLESAAGSMNGSGRQDQ